MNLRRLRARLDDCNMDLEQLEAMERMDGGVDTVRRLELFKRLKRNARSVVGMAAALEEEAIDGVDIIREVGGTK